MVEQKTYWEKCRTCGKVIGFNSRYYTCSVSSCNRKSNPLVFCSVNCWDIHAPVMNHKNAGADENFSPSKSDSVPQPPRKILINSPKPSEQEELSSVSDQDILIVASKLKAYIKDRSGLQTSAGVMEVLSDKVRQLCDQAIVKARRDNRKTVMERDF